MSNTKKYGLQLRVPPSQQKKQPTRPPLPTPLGFDDDDDDSVERDILRQASKNKSLKDIEEQHKKALEEDPSVFEYDGVYDKMKEKSVQPVVQDRQDRKPKYIQALIEKAKIREREHEIIYEKKLSKERSKDEHVYADKDKFVTSAYKRKLAEQAKWLEEERIRELREEKEDVTKKTDISDFYFNLGKNVAFGGGVAVSGKPKEKQEEMVIQSQESTESVAPATNTSTESSRLIKRQHRETSEDRSSEEKIVEGFAEPVSDASTQDQAAAKPSTTNQPRPEHHKRSDDAVAAAKERFLARKRAKEQ
ncbi:nuclear speckle splicing regulatory protein 1-like [Olea europaea var. sylvestris]|uniref:nuclear speckle splicing regulatory protein 1-like n=1 Tax=Olea europaea var. sylvestris TaxID=158386 RepID=UPI000C1D6AEB|nr:nuclear speckle splicing regulatory protein 1-like [Olea europaea var. sylvestris]XP_022869556.1 nuclear speckle splicing regulatory protein 1-like [Olea europaea var. sylvestris]